MARAAIRLPVEPPFDLELVLFGHGWIDLAPHVWEPGARRFETVLDLGEDVADVGVAAEDGALAVELRAHRPLAPPLRRAARAALSRMLRLGHDYRPFWRLCRGIPELGWVARRGGGRLMASPTLFEDLLRILLTTNCSWAATRLMVRRLVDAIGPRAPSGRAAFPSAARCALEPERFWRDVVRAGYRARAASELARRFASGELDEAGFEDPARPTDELRRRLLALRGFGPYSAGQALRLLGRHDDLALDSSCRSGLARMLGRARPPSDRAIERRYARFGGERGLVLWMELTAEWHGERESRAPSPLAARRGAG